MDERGKIEDNTEEVKYRGVRKRPWGNLLLKFAILSDKEGFAFGSGHLLLQKKAARAYDKAAYSMRGNLAILKCPEEYNLHSSSSHFNTDSSSMASTSVQARNEQVLELEYLDDKLIEELLHCDQHANKKK